MKRLSPKRKAFFLDIILVALLFCFTSALFYTGSLRGFDNKYYDVLTRIKRSTPAKRSDVVIVVIDQNSLSFFNQNKQGWPWPRDFYARLTHYLTVRGANAVIFDIFFSENDIDRMNAADGDNAFGEAVTESEKTFFVLEFEKEGKPDSIPLYNKAFLPRIDYLLKYTIPNFNSSVFPIPIIAENARGFGLATILLDADGIVRRYPLASRYNGKYVPTIGLEVVRKVLGEERIDSWLARKTRSGGMIDDNGNLLLNWYGPGDSVGETFRYYPFQNVIRAASLVEEGKPDTLGIHFKDKIVLIGANAPGLLDNKSTPVSGSSKYPFYPGVEIHATAIENFLSDDFISTAPQWMVCLLMALAAALLFAVLKMSRNLRLFVASSFILLAAEGVLSWFLLLHNFWLPSMGLFLTTSLVFMGLITSGYFNETRETRVLRRYFERYVNDSVLEEILANPTSVDLKGRTIRATVMATDIQDFTNISESTGAYDLVARLNDYLSEVSEVLITNGAFINKYIGDAILAIYGAFGEDTEHRRKACYAALAAMEAINRKAEQARAEGKTPFITRIGVNTGEMTMGNIGSLRKIEFTVIGDGVNSAFRLEGINKYYNTRILVSEYTREGAEKDFEFRLIDVLQYKGKDTPVRIYELLGEKGKVDPEILRRRDEYERAFNLHTERRFSEARDTFARLREEGDPPAGAMEGRCARFVEVPPPDDWNGVWKMLRK